MDLNELKAGIKLSAEQRLENLRTALGDLTTVDLDLIASTLGDTDRLVDEDSGNDAEARVRAYKALSLFVRSMIPAA